MGTLADWTLGGGGEGRHAKFVHFSKHNKIVKQILYVLFRKISILHTFHTLISNSISNCSSGRILRVCAQAIDLTPRGVATGVCVGGCHTPK